MHSLVLFLPGSDVTLTNRCTHVHACMTVDRMCLVYLMQAGNIAELLVKEGFSRCVDWSMAFVTQGRDKLRAAEK